MIEKILIYLIYPLLFLYLIFSPLFSNTRGKDIPKESFTELSSSIQRAEDNNRQARDKVESSLNLNRFAEKGIDKLENINSQLERFIQEN